MLCKVGCYDSYHTLAMVSAVFFSELSDMWVLLIQQQTCKSMYTLLGIWLSFNSVIVCIDHVCDVQGVFEAILWVVTVNGV